MTGLSNLGWAFRFNNGIESPGVGVEIGMKSKEHLCGNLIQYQTELQTILDTEPAKMRVE
jgi:hypothetical protein